MAPMHTFPFLVASSPFHLVQGLLEHLFCWKVCRCAWISHWESLESEWQKKSSSCDINSQPLWVLSPALWKSWAVNLGSFHWVSILIVVTICGSVLGVLRYSLHQLFALKYFVGELLLLRNGARWTVLRSKVLTLSADHGTSSGTQSSSSSVFLHHQPENSRGKGLQSLWCLSRETNIRVTCWGDRFETHLL